MGICGEGVGRALAEVQLGQPTRSGREHLEGGEGVHVLFGTQWDIGLCATVDADELGDAVEAPRSRCVRVWM